MVTSLVTIEITEQIATITLNRPEKLNALNPEMLDTLLTLCNELEHNTEVRAVILSGEGRRAFCVGADIKAWSSLDPIDMWRQWVRYGHQVFERIEKLRQPIIGVLNGFTFGGGLELALACDIRIAATSAEFAMPEVTIGTVPGWGGTHRLPALIGASRAKLMMLTGDRIDTKQAERWGLIDMVSNPDELMDTAHILATKIANNAPIAVQITKELINTGKSSQLGIIGEGIAGALAASTTDGQEGILSFTEKRSPKFTGS